MKIIIADHEYIYSYIGETIPRPTMSTFVINEDDISEFHKYYWDIAAYDRKKEKLVEICSSVICIAIYIAEIAYLLICKENLESYDFIIAFIGLFLGCLIPAFIQAALLHALIIGPLLKKIIAKMVKGHPIKPDKWANVRDYENACKNFENTTTKWQSKFPGIQDVNYDLSAYGVNCLNSTIEELAAFTNSQNEIIRKDVLRQYQQYWFDLDPFDFEAEVAHWFEQQGYRSKITKKSNDGGVDIIIYKNGYRAYVQCKRYRTTKVDRPTLNALYGVVCADSVSEGIVVTLLGVTNEAKEFAKKVGIKVITINDLASERGLLNDKVKSKLLNPQPIKINNYWIKIGDIGLNTNCYRTQDDVLNRISGWANTECYHPIEYKGIYLCVYCNDDNHQQLIEWFRPKIQNNTFSHSNNKRKKSYRKRYRYY